MAIKRTWPPRNYTYIRSPRINCLTSRLVKSSALGQAIIWIASYTRVHVLAAHSLQFMLATDRNNATTTVHTTGSRYSAGDDGPFQDTARLCCWHVRSPGSPRLTWRWPWASQWPLNATHKSHASLITTFNGVSVRHTLIFRRRFWRLSALLRNTPIHAVLLSGFCLSVRQFVCLSQSGSLSKRLNL